MDNSDIDNDGLQADSLTEREKLVRDKFVREYLKDYDQYKACLRVGYSPAWAKEFAVRFMEEPYVLQQIQNVQNQSEEIDAETEKRRIKAALWREANNFGPGSSQAARVAALAKLSAFQGMDAPTRSKTEMNITDGGVFIVPGIMTPEQWAAQAESQQEELVRPTSPPELKAVS